MRRTLATLVVLLLIAGSAVAQEAPKPPGPVSAADRPHDRGEVVLVKWEASPSDGVLAGFDGYVIQRRSLVEVEDEETGELVPQDWDPLNKGKPFPAGTTEVLDRRASAKGQIEYRVFATANGVSSEGVLSAPTTAALCPIS